MKVTIIPIIIGALGMVHKGLKMRLKELEIERQIETIQTTAPLQSPDHRIKLKETEKRDKYLDLDRKLKKTPLWNMKVTVTPIVIGLVWFGFFV